jgi:hypothetical protein
MGARNTRSRSAPSLGLVALLSLAGILSATPAAAYLDPASSSYVIQILLAMLVSLGVAVRHYWTRLTSFWTRLTGRAPEKPASKDLSSGPPD